MRDNTFLYVPFYAFFKYNNLAFSCGAAFKEQIARVGVVGEAVLPKVGGEEKCIQGAEWPAMMLPCMYF